MGNHPTFEERVNAFLPQVLRDLQESALLRAEEAKWLGLDPQSKAKAKAKAEAEANAKLDAETKELLLDVQEQSHPHQPRIGAPKGPSGVRNPANDYKRDQRRHAYRRQYVWQNIDLRLAVATPIAPAAVVSPEEFARRAEQSAKDKAKAKAEAEARAEAKKAKAKPAPTPKRGPKNKAEKAERVSTLPAKPTCEQVGNIPADALVARQERATEVRAMRMARTLALKGITRLLTQEEKAENRRAEIARHKQKMAPQRLNQKEKEAFLAFGLTAMAEVKK
jgi:hypothetical protein